jgi:RNase P subunit RPR2
MIQKRVIKSMTARTVIKCENCSASLVEGSNCYYFANSGMKMKCKKCEKEHEFVNDQIKKECRSKRFNENWNFQKVLKK